MAPTPSRVAVVLPVCQAGAAVFREELSPPVLGGLPPLVGLAEVIRAWTARHRPDPPDPPDRPGRGGRTGAASARRSPPPGSVAGMVLPALAEGAGPAWFGPLRSGRTPTTCEMGGWGRADGA